MYTSKHTYVPPSVCRKTFMTLFALGVAKRYARFWWTKVPGSHLITLNSDLENECVYKVSF